MRQSGPARFNDSQAAETAFYRALAEADYPLMSAVWQAHDAVVCIHPYREALLGHDAVMASWREILAQGPTLKISWTLLQTQKMGDCMAHTVEEVLTILAEPHQAPSVMVATNLYRPDDDGQWRLLLHHASPLATAEPHQSGETLH